MSDVGWDTAAPPLHLELLELTFDVCLQRGEHGLVLAGQVPEPAEATVTATPAPAGAPGPSPSGLRRCRYRAENSSKSDRRSQTRRPARAALDE